jgi:4-amino-4-deoxy-L-arabinose transferase-like glycosyltransferase
MNAPARTRPTFPAWGQLLVLLAVCAFVYFFRLGEGGFFGTEAHRAVPAYELLDLVRNHAVEPDDIFIPTMFEQPYLRKPPGMPWAIMGMSALLGETVFAARAVSALSCTIMAIFAFGFAYRWFGRRAALPAGLAQALMPVLWETGRAAEIEPLNNLGTQIAALALIDAIVFARTRPDRVLSAMVAAFGIIWFTLAKGPASAPVVAGVAIAACLALRSWRPLASVVWITLVIAGVTIAGLARITFYFLGEQPIEPVTQSPGAFMFEPGMLLGVLTLPFAAFASMLPASFALLFPWGPDARRESSMENGPGDHRFRIVRTLAFAWLITIVLFMAFGVRNPRYTLPAACLLPPLAGFYLAGLGSWLSPKRDSIARTLTLGRPAILAVALLIGAGVYMFTVEANRRATTGAGTGAAIGEALAAWAESHPDRVVIIADDVIEARPEVVLEIERTLEARGIHHRVIWTPGLEIKGRDLAETDTLIAMVRTDAESRESGLETIAGRPLNNLSVAPEPGGWEFHKYRADLYLVEPRPFAN